MVVKTVVYSSVLVLLTPYPLAVVGYASWSVGVVCRQWVRYDKCWRCVRSNRSCSHLVSRSVQRQRTTWQPASHLHVSLHSTSTARRHLRSLSDAGERLRHRPMSVSCLLFVTVRAPLYFVYFFLVPALMGWRPSGIQPMANKYCCCCFLRLSPSCTVSIPRNCYFEI